MPILLCVPTVVAVVCRFLDGCLAEMGERDSPEMTYYFVELPPKVQHLFRLVVSDFRTGCDVDASSRT